MSEGRTAGGRGRSEGSRGAGRGNGRHNAKYNQDGRGSSKGRSQRGVRDDGNPRNGRDARNEDKRRSSSPQRSGYREERLNKRLTEPDLPDDIDVFDLDPLVLQDLRVLAKDNAEAVAKHMIMSAQWMDDDPQLSLRHARAAKDRAGRVSVVRELAGIAAYRAGEWKEALSELRAARRMSGGPGLLAVMADCERGLGRPEKAIEIGRSDEVRQLDAESVVELAIVMAGARQDLGQNDSAVVTLQRVNPTKEARGVTATRLAYAYANALLLAGREDEAKDWFAHTVSIDEYEATDARERLEELS